MTAAPMARQPAAGELLAFFVTAGDQRKKDVATVRERSNVVLVTMPAATPAIYPFSAPAPVPTPVPPAPIPLPPPPPAPEPPAPLPSVDVCAGLGVQIAHLQQQEQANSDAIRGDVRSFREAADGVLKLFVKYALPAIGGLVAGIGAAK
jgi:hypothetical protein